MEEEKKDLEALLRSGIPVGFRPQGNSMRPTIVPGRDSVTVFPIDGHNLKRGDVALFRRPLNVPGYPGMLVIHRVFKVTEDGVYMVGDNEKQVEGPIPKEQFLGYATEIIRKGKRIKTTNLFYRFLTRTWLFLRPFRFILGWPLKFFKKS